MIRERRLRPPLAGHTFIVVVVPGDWVPEEEIAAHQKRSRAAWEALEKHDVTEASDLKLDFFYDVPGADAAKELADFLRTETDYDVEFNEESVTGTTQPKTVNPSILDEWVEWMVLAGYENGRCKFDGWGADVP